MMQPPRSYRVLLVGAASDQNDVEAALHLAAGSFETWLHTPEGDGDVQPPPSQEASPDVIVIGSTADRPLPIARHLRALFPRAQVVFLLRPERIEAFRAGLPFVPNLASAWTADATDPPQSLARLIAEAARTAREKSDTSALFGRINKRLASGNVAPSQLRRSQLALSEHYLATVLAQSPDALLAVDGDGNLIAANDAAQGLFGTVVEPEAGIRLVEMFPLAERPLLEGLLERAGSGEVLVGRAVRFARPDGLERDLELSLAPVRDDTGSIASVSITARDISERKRAEERQRLLLNELSHRVKNTLAIVQALAQQSIRGKAPAEQERAAFNARLGTLAAAHDLLTRETWEPVSLAKVIEAAAGAACGAGPDRHDISGPDVLLPPQTAVSLAMAMHELCTNAIKYGALSNESGKVLTRWEIVTMKNGPGLHLEWIEVGGPAVEAPTRRGFGTRMIERGLASELNGSVEMEFRREGLRCIIDAPLPNTVGSKTDSDRRRRAHHRLRAGGDRGNARLECHCGSHASRPGAANARAQSARCRDPRRQSARRTELSDRRQAGGTRCTVRVRHRLWRRQPSRASPPRADADQAILRRSGRGGTFENAEQEAGSFSKQMTIIAREYERTAAALSASMAL